MQLWTILLHVIWSDGTTQSYKTEISPDERLKRLFPLLPSSLADPYTLFATAHVTFHNLGTERPVNLRFDCCVGDLEDLDGLIDLAADINWVLCPDDLSNADLSSKAFEENNIEWVLSG